MQIKYSSLPRAIFLLSTLLICSPIFPHGGYQALVPVLAHAFIILPLLGITILGIILNLKFRNKWLYRITGILILVGCCLSVSTIIYGFQGEVFFAILMALASFIIHVALLLFSYKIMFRKKVQM